MTATIVTSSEAEDVARFGEFFSEVHGYEPFPWQARLVEALLNKDWPEVIDVPTGLGKTSVIDAWIYALAQQPPGDTATTFPRRLSFVVDRRIIVDDAHEHAEQLAEALATASPGTLASDCAQQLLRLTANAGVPLSVVHMRGGITWESRWLERPDQPAVITGTVDQLGSRILFRGYGVSPGMRPINAALVGLDTWVVVDEAHIAEPLVATTERVRRLQGQHSPFADRALRLTLMSATARQSPKALHADLATETTSEMFPQAAQEAAKRLSTAKPVALIDLEWLGTKKRNGWLAQSAHLGVALAELARSLGVRAKVIGIIANTVSTARTAFDHLMAQDEQAILLTGRCRPFERERIQADWLPKIQVRSPRDFDGRLYVVATQTIEVGANLDLDLLVTEAAPMSSLVQRFGRVNRLGDHQVHLSVIVHAGFAHDDDPIYGDTTDTTWNWLAGRAQTVDLIGKLNAIPRLNTKSRLDFGPAALQLHVDNLPEAARPKTPDTPIILGAHVERWANTRPAPSPDQPVAPFLHGVQRGSPDVAVAWRTAPPPLLDNVGNPAEDPWRVWLALVPPVSWEFIDVPLWEVRALLAGSPPDIPTADLEGTFQPVMPEPEVGSDALGVIYESADELALIRGPGDVRPGDRVILRSDLGGHDDWGWTGTRAQNKDVPDVGDIAPTRLRPVMRLAQEVLTTWVGTESSNLWESIRPLDPKDPMDFAKILGALDAAGIPHQMERGLQDAIPTVFASIGEEPVTLVLGRSLNGGVPTDFVSDDASTSTSMTASQVTLTDHGTSVGVMAREFGQNLCLPESIIRTLELAGRFHDLGKLDPRFQVALHLGDEIAALASPQPLAKSGRDPRDPLARQAWASSELKLGFRHEALSERLLASLMSQEPDLAEGVDEDLLLHLVASHHGHGRPLMPPVPEPDSPETLTVMFDGHVFSAGPRESQVDWSHPKRFERLNQEYGSWGLATLETLVRLADMLCSEQGR